MILPEASSDWFKTSNYIGAWIPFNGDRALFRSKVQQCLRILLEDPNGVLSVTDRGPIWTGQITLRGLSYAQTSQWGVVVGSKNHALGVDVEASNRVLNQDCLKIAKRFFHPTESAKLETLGEFQRKSAFLDLWMKKEAFSKLKRDHLVEWISKEILPLSHFESLPKIRNGFEAWVAIEF